MTYTEFQNSFPTAEEFKKALADLTEDEVRELIGNSNSGTTVKACMFGSWKSARQELGIALEK